jgi:hypothetical protein
VALSAEDFRGGVGEAHRLVPLGVPSDAPLEMLLDSVNELPTRSPQLRAPFDLLFRAPLGTDLGQGTFRLERADRESLELFLVPIGPAVDGEGVLYQAVFG